jgi:hypothetical protein
MASFAAAHDAFFIDGDSQTLAVISAGGATTSTTIFVGQTRALQLTALASVTSTSGCRVKVISPADSVVSSTAGFVVVPNWPQVVKVNPGQRISAISNDGAAITLVVTPLTD